MAIKACPTLISLMRTFFPMLPAAVPPAGKSTTGEQAWQRPRLLYPPRHLSLTSCDRPPPAAVAATRGPEDGWLSRFPRAILLKPIVPARRFSSRLLRNRYGPHTPHPPSVLSRPQTQADAHVAGWTGRRPISPAFGQSNRPSVRVADRQSCRGRNRQCASIAAQWCIESCQSWCCSRSSCPPSTCL
jgi:hypothetical protein